MNISNSLTILRILIVPVFVILIIYNYLKTALIAFIIAAVTDGVDGFIARVYDQKTPLGSYLDPSADKLLLVSAYITLTIKGYLPSWLTVIIVSRDIILIMGFMVFSLLNRKTIEVSPTLISKVTTCFQIIVIVVILLTINNPLYYIYVIYWITAILTVISGLFYILPYTR